MGKNIRKCPYCSGRVTYFEALSELSSGEHTCRNCNRNANISFNKKIYIPTAIILAAAIGAAFLLFKLNIIKNFLLASLIVIIPFVVFYLLTPMYYYLTPISREAARIPVAPKKKKRTKRQKPENVADRSSDNKNKNNKRKEKETGSQRELDNMAKQGSSFKDKFNKFIKTYVIVDDDEEEGAAKTGSDSSYDDNEDLGDSSQSWSVMNNYDESEQSYDDFSDDAYSSYEPKKEIEDVYSSSAFEEEEQSFKFDEDNFEEEPEIAAVPEIKKPEPVYHKMTKTSPYRNSRCSMLSV